jgi:tRNA-dihydrouridine synthase
LFNEEVDEKKVTPDQKIDLLLKHLGLFKDVWGDTKNFAVMKRFVKCYVNNFNGASDLREILMATKSLDELLSAASQIQPSKL